MGKPPLLPEPLAIISYHLPQFHYLWTSLFGINKGLNQTEKISVKSRFHKPPVSISFPRKVLFFSPRWMGIHQSWECLIALALTLRYGTDCFFLHCGKVKTACDLWRKEKRGRHLCSLCDYYLSFFLDTLHLEHKDLSRYANIQELKNSMKQSLEKAGENLWEGYMYKDLNLKEMVGASFCRYLREYRIQHTPSNFRVLKDFLLSAALIEHLFLLVLEEQKPDLAILMNGKFFPERIAFELCKRKGIPVVTHERGALIGTITLNWNAPVIPYSCEQGWKSFHSRDLTPLENKELDEYLYGRRFGKKMQVNFWPSIQEDVSSIETQLNVRFDEQPCDVLFTNVIWDTAVYHEDTIFPSMFDWINETIRIYSGFKGRRLFVRIHPSEIRDPFLETVEKSRDSIYRAFPRLPENVIIIPPESNISSYTLIDKCQKVIVYTSTIGLEAAILGKPVIQCAHSNYSGKGFTIEPASGEEYERALREIISLPPPNSKDLARRFAYLLYFKYMIPLSSVSEMNGDFRFHLDSFDDLKDGTLDVGLSRIIDCIRFQKSFHLELE